LYLIDTNALIDLFDRFYCADVFPTLAADIAAVAAQQKLFVITEVDEELQTNLSESGYAEFETLNISCLNGNQAVQQKHGEIMAHLSANHREKLVRNFSAGADTALVAHAAVHQKILITDERGQIHTNTKLFIPPLARRFGVVSIDIVEFFRREGLRY
tara:strand:- start:452 stop:925 length:474 start_codon:yes stop_codon:yes gene_type:complete